MSASTTIIQARVPLDLAERLKSHAEATERTVSADVRFAVRQLLGNDNAARTRGGAVNTLAEEAGEHGSA